MKRFKVLLRALNTTTIPYSYNLPLYSTILNLLGEEEAYMIHKSPLPLINFSRLMAPRWVLRPTPKGLKVGKNSLLTLHISFVEDAIALSFLKRVGRTIKLKELNLSIQSPQLEVFKPSSLYATLSPIVVRKEGIYLKPTEREFWKELEENARRKTGVKVTFKPVEVVKEKKIQIKNNKVIAYDLLFSMEGPREALNLLFHTGIGEKNKLGFGMFAPTKKPL